MATGQGTHFVKYPLQSAKIIDFKLWQQCVQLIGRKEHLTESGFNQILSLKSALNLGLPEKIKAAFPKAVALERPAYTGPVSPLNPHWVSGFTEGDGSFSVSIPSNGNEVKASYTIRLNKRETPLLHEI